MGELALVVLCAWLGLMVLELRLTKRPALNPHAPWLGRQCVVTFGGHSYLARCVAVSWHGAVAVRGEISRTSSTVWVSKQDVPTCVRWC